MKLELKHLAPYLPYSLKIQFTQIDDDGIGGIGELYKIETGKSEKRLFEIDPTIIVGDYELYILEDDIKPILRPLSDLTKEIEVNGEKFVPYDYFYDDSENDWFDGNVWMNYMFEGNIEKSDFDFIPYYIIQKLFEWHFDVFELIENRLAVDINTIKD